MAQLTWLSAHTASSLNGTFEILNLDWFSRQWKATMYGNPPLWPNIPSGEGGGGWSEWSGRFPNASRNEESEDQNIEENIARNDILLI